MAEQITRVYVVKFKAPASRSFYFVDDAGNGNRLRIHARRFPDWDGANRVASYIRTSNGYETKIVELKKDG